MVYSGNAFNWILQQVCNFQAIPIVQNPSEYGRTEDSTGTGFC